MIYPKNAKILQNIQINQCDHINILKGKNHMTVSIDTGNAFNKIQHSLMIKKTQNRGKEKTFLNIIKALHEKPKDNVNSMVKS